MLSTRALPQGWRLRAHGILLALALAVMASIAARYLGALRSGNSPLFLSPVFCAVILGMAWRNGVGVNARTDQGVQWITQTLLRVGIALVGLRLTLHGLTTLGVLAVPVVTGCILIALTASQIVGRWLKIAAPLRSLIAVGTAVCGCTAVVAVAPAVRAKPEETGLALTCVVLFGSLGMLVYPWLAHELLGADGQAAGIFLGTAIHDTSQVIGASLIYSQQFASPETVATAGFTKLLRNLSLLVLVPLLAGMCRERTEHSGKSGGSSHWRTALPGFLIAFLLFALARSIGDALFLGSPVADVWQGTIAFGLAASELFLVCGMAAVGLSVSLKHVRDLGWRAPLAAFLVALSVALVSLALTAGMVAWS
ncbi:YeiH family protein [Povalibacter sp.]|uniref:YeiH family protein n=1 Tax=Povalibacter sp. TaxID=1962978 RepID=UPI002F41B083